MVRVIKSVTVGPRNSRVARVKTLSSVNGNNWMVTASHDGILLLYVVFSPEKFHCERSPQVASSRLGAFAAVSVLSRTNAKTLDDSENKSPKANGPRTDCLCEALCNTIRRRTSRRVFFVEKLPESKTTEEWTERAYSANTKV